MFRIGAPLGLWLYHFFNLGAKWNCQDFLYRWLFHNTGDTIFQFKVYEPG